jgi:hypothetical protein
VWKHQQRSGPENISFAGISGVALQGPILKPCLCPPLQEIARKRVLIISEPSSSPRASFASNTPAGMPDAANTPGLWPGLVSEGLSSTQHVTVADCIAQKQPVHATVAHGP